MSETKIEWAHYTFNCWRGCAKVSPGCAHCYAETMSRRNPKVLGEWGPDGTRVVAAEPYWRLPAKWDRQAAAAGERRRVFCASLADVFEDRPELEAPRLRLASVIHQTPHLDWLLLTKRPEFARGWIDRNHHSWTADMDGPPKNVWLGVSVEDQARADERVPHLLRTPAAVRFLSCEPLLGPVDLFREPHRRHWLHARCDHPDEPTIDWVIAGGESGPGARPCDVNWVRSLVRQCREAGVACFVKQLGAHPRESHPEDPEMRLVWRRVPGVRHPKGGDPQEWPEDLRVREFPRV